MIFSVIGAPEFSTKQSPALVLQKKQKTNVCIPTPL